MGKITVEPLAFESLGVRSMSCLIETPDVKILVDPGIALGPRFGLLPHPKEYRARSQLRSLLIEKSHKADVITISHYHHDHYTPNYVENVFIGSSPEDAAAIIKDKTLIIKNFRENVNASQRRRGWLFWKFAQKYSREILTADGREFQSGDTKIKFSRPVPHGEAGSSLGWVTMLLVSVDNFKVMHASDIQGPIFEGTADMILKENPEILIVGGPPLYLAGGLVDEVNVSHSKENLNKLCQVVETIILDHHIMRSLDCHLFVEPIERYAESIGHVLVSAAKFKGLEDNLLEARRNELYRKEPPSSEFLAWTRLPWERRRVEPPPV
ncbi:MAG: MBL fold metallo-hydrolase [Candidatus Bathyarchaeia archaeon]|nr:MBL fold metallo-hydrolase [Candidatus Bathyarchaeota archaeon]